MLCRLKQITTTSVVALAVVFPSNSNSAVDIAPGAIAPGAIKLESELKTELLPGDVADPLEDKTKTSSPEYIVVPLPSRNSLLGWVIAVPAVAIYRPANSSEGDGAWTTGVAGFYAENKSWGGGGFHKMSVDNDRWRFLGAAAYTDLRYDYYGIGGAETQAIPLRQPISFVMAEGLREVTEGLYLGLRYSYALTSVQLNTSDDGAVVPDRLPPDFDRDFNLATLSLQLIYDTRDNEFYPSEGFLIEGSAKLGREALGGDLDYQIYQLKINHYQEMGPKGILALRGVIKYAGEDAPFFLYPAFGQGADLRGYTTGTYRDQFLTAVQAEYRHRFTESIGAVVFGGVGSVAPEFAGWETTLPSVGIGFRYVIAKENNISLRIDYAWGRDDHQFYLSLKEAF